MAATLRPTATSGYRWLENDIIRGVYQPDEKLCMSLLTSYCKLGVGPLRETLSQSVAEWLVTVVNQKGYRVTPMSEQELLDIFNIRANMEAVLIALAVEHDDDAWETEIPVRAHTLGKLEAIDVSERMLDEWDQHHQVSYSAIVAGYGLQYLLQTRGRLFSLATRYRSTRLRRTVLSAEILESRHDRHKALTEATLTHDVVHASELIRQHLLMPVPVIQQAMSGKPLT